MLTALGLRGFVMQIYTVRSGGCRMWRTRGGGRGRGVFTPNSHVRSSEVSNWQTFESHFADERIKWQSAQKLLQNIRITEMFLLLLYIHILYIHIYATISFSRCQFYLHFVVQNFLAFRNLLFHTLCCPRSCCNWNVH